MERMAAWLVAGIALFAATAHAQEWTAPVRGSWVQTAAAQPADVTLATPATAAEIVIARNEHTAVQHAAKLLAEDIEKISGKKPAVVEKPSKTDVRIHLVTLGNGRVPAGVNTSKLKGQWEAYQVYTEPKDVWLVGSDFRGTAFAAYTLSERLGIDPLYIWTGYKPAHRNPLVLKKANVFTASPTFKYRGMFHDDEDILPRPFDAHSGYPSLWGTVPDVWYERFFETALRLRMNMVAPWTRTHRHFRIQKMASDWGLFYTSHHYDILLSNPYGYDRMRIAKARGISGAYDYLGNKSGVLAYWKAGAEENRDLDATYPVGLRGTEDYGYKFPPDATPDDKARVYSEAIREQLEAARASMPPGKSPVFTFTLYDEMLGNFRSGRFDIPDEAIIIWSDDWDGIMRDLPDPGGRRRHGVYYHLAYQGGKPKQTVNTVTPMRIEQEFRRIMRAGATEYMLVNVSELRDYVMGTRMLADITWNADAAFARPDAAGRFVDWWCREYFGAAVAPDAAAAYSAYYEILPAYDSIWYGSDRVSEALLQLMKKVNGETFEKLPAADVEQLNKRLAAYDRAMPTLDRASAAMSPEQQQFFHENVRLGLAMDYAPTKAALLLDEALEAPDNNASMTLVRQAKVPLARLEADIRSAERPPFQGWYRPTWARPSDYSGTPSRANPHRAYDMLTLFLQGRP